MKKLSVLLIAALLISVLAGCSLQQSIQGISKKAEDLPILEMAQLLADGDEDAFLSHIHPAIDKDGARNGYKYMADYMHGYQPVSVECLGANISSNIGTDGKSSSVSASYVIFFDQGSILVDAVYIEDGDGSGFTQFLCKIGIAP